MFYPLIEDVDWDSASCGGRYDWLSMGSHRYEDHVIVFAEPIEQDRG